MFVFQEFKFLLIIFNFYLIVFFSILKILIDICNTICDTINYYTSYNSINLHYWVFAIIWNINSFKTFLFKKKLLWLFNLKEFCVIMCCDENNTTHLVHERSRVSTGLYNTNIPFSFEQCINVHFAIYWNSWGTNSISLKYSLIIA